MSESAILCGRSCCCHHREADELKKNVLHVSQESHTRALLCPLERQHFRLFLSLSLSWFYPLNSSGCRSEERCIYLRSRRAGDCSSVCDSSLPCAQAQLPSYVVQMKILSVATLIPCRQMYVHRGMGYWDPWIPKQALDANLFNTVWLWACWDLLDEILLSDHTHKVSVLIGHVPTDGQMNKCHLEFRLHEHISMHHYPSSIPHCSCVLSDPSRVLFSASSIYEVC